METGLEFGGEGTARAIQNVILHELGRRNGDHRDSPWGRHCAETHFHSCSIAAPHGPKCDGVRWFLFQKLDSLSSPLWKSHFRGVHPRVVTYSWLRMLRKPDSGKDVNDVSRQS